MRTLTLRALVGVCFLASIVTAASPRGTLPIYPQLICVVPMVGAGTMADPRRPLYAPIAGETPETKAHSKGFAAPARITAYRSVISDDGAFAIVLFEAHDRAAFRPILSDRSLLKSFDPATTPIESLLPFLQTLKKNFDLRMLKGGGL